MEEPQEKPQPRYIRHLGWTKSPDGKHDGVVTCLFELVGDVVIRDEEYQEWKVGLSFCSPSDRFDKKEAIRRAARRLKRHPLPLTINKEFYGLGRMAHRVASRTRVERPPYIRVHTVRGTYLEWLTPDWLKRFNPPPPSFEE